MKWAFNGHYIRFLLGFDKFHGPVAWGQLLWQLGNLKCYNTCLIRLPPLQIKNHSSSCTLGSCHISTNHSPDSGSWQFFPQILVTVLLPTKKRKRLGWCHTARGIYTSGDSRKVSTKLKDKTKFWFSWNSFGPAEWPCTGPIGKAIFWKLIEPCLWQNLIPQTTHINPNVTKNVKIMTKTNFVWICSYFTSHIQNMTDFSCNLFTAN